MPPLADAAPLDFEPSDFPPFRAAETVMVEPAHSPERRSDANNLLSTRYRYRGYAEVSLPAFDSCNHLPLVATCAGVSTGTLTVSLEGPLGLSCEATFPDEVQALRDAGHRLCEFTRLAIDPARGSRHVLASLFHVAYLVATRLGSADMVLLEVNPRHVGYYRRILGARVVGAQRFHQRVQAPAVLLSIKFEDVRDRIDQVTSSLTAPLPSRSLYTLAFSSNEEDAIVARIAEHVHTTGRRYEPFAFRLPLVREAPAANAPQPV